MSAGGGHWATEGHWWPMRKVGVARARRGLKFIFCVALPSDERTLATMGTCLPLAGSKVTVQGLNSW